MIPLNRFAYVDVAVGCVLRNSIVKGILRRVYSYDSNCGYEVKLFLRLAGYEPVLITLEELLEMDFHPVIPKFHLGGHKPECADKYSLNYKENVGRMSGEGVETPWAALNRLQYSTREMGHGNRRDMLTDHFMAWNWWKNVRAGEFGCTHHI